MNRLKELREKSGLSLAELAERSDLDQHWLAQLEAGQTQADPASLAKLVDGLNGALFDKNIQITAQDIETEEGRPSTIATADPEVTHPVESSGSGIGKAITGGKSGPAIPTITSYRMPSLLPNGTHDHEDQKVATGSTPVKAKPVNQPAPPASQPVTAPGVVSSPPGYLSYQTKKQAEQIKLMRKLVPLVIGLAIFGWVIWQLVQQVRQKPVSPFSQSQPDVIILPANE